MIREKYAKQLFYEERGSSYRAGGSTKAALVFPNSYYLGMSSLGFQVILDEINRHPDVSCERAFFSEDKQSEIPRSFETQRPLSEFHIIGFSISFELDYFNVVKILHTAKIPLWAKDRGVKDPVIIAGGICCSFNPEPISGFVDAFVIGDGEETIHDLISEYQSWRQTKDSREDLFYRLSRIEGVYVPSLYEMLYKEDGTLSRICPQPHVKPEVKRSSVRGLDRFDTASKILTPNTEFACSFLVEVTRGCIHRCKFCVASHIQECRIRSKGAILKLAQSELAKKAEKIGLVGSSVTDHPQVDEVARSLVDMGGKISIASLRADSVSDKLLDALAASGQKTITLAPETASERLRKVIGKNMPLEAIFQAVRSALKRGILNLKLYFMIGLPTEVQKDVDEIVVVIEEIKQLMLDSPRPRPSIAPRLSISVSPFVPKPHTPFQWCRMEDVKTLSQKLRFLRRKLESIGGIRVSSSSARWSAVQGVLARGDRRLANVLYDVGRESIPWNRALKRNCLMQDFYQSSRQIHKVLPWDHLKQGIPRWRLAEQFLAISD